MKKTIEKICKNNEAIMMLNMLLQILFLCLCKDRIAVIICFSVGNSISIFMLIANTVNVLLKNSNAKNKLKNFVLPYLAVVAMNFWYWNPIGWPIVWKFFWGYFASITFIGILYSFYPDSKKQDQLVV